MRKLVAILTLLPCVVVFGSARDPSNYFYRISPANGPLKVEPVWFAPTPDYPPEARRRRLVGKGLFAIHIGNEGRVQSVDVIKTSGHSLLDRAAIDAFRRWRFRPRSIGSVSVPIEYTFEPGVKSGVWGRNVEDLKELGDGVGIVVQWHVAAKQE
jgi:TonB family protein